METYNVIVNDPSIYWYNELYQLHRLNGPAIEYANGSKHWFYNGQRHRLDGPAIEFDNGSKYWYQNDKYHRLDGPAIELAHGLKEYWINGIKYTKEEFDARTKKTITIKQIEEILGYSIKIVKEE